MLNSQWTIIQTSFIPGWESRGIGPASANSFMSGRMLINRKVPKQTTHPFMNHLTDLGQFKSMSLVSLKTPDESYSFSTEEDKGTTLKSKGLSFQ